MAAIFNDYYCNLQNAHVIFHNNYQNPDMTTMTATA